MALRKAREWQHLNDPAAANRIHIYLGGNDSWSDVAAPLHKYQMPAKPYRYSFI